MDLRDYKAAKPRFVIDDVNVNGVRLARITDPVLGIELTVPLEQRDLLLWLFREPWITGATETQTRH